MWVRRGTGTPTDGTGTLATAGTGWRTAAGARAAAVDGPGATAGSSAAIGASAAAIDTVVVMAGNCGAGGMAQAW